tara:strand:+ start:8234 stop:9217 length:984 start_codon:yes stop_codon:yes gene_type:complete
MALKRIELQLWVYTGITTDAPSSPTYTMSKTIVTSQTRINFEISELVKDYIIHKFDNDYTSDCVWVKVFVEKFDDEDVSYSYDNYTTIFYEALSGWGAYEDGASPELSTDALVSTSNMYVPENTASKIPIWAAGVGKFIIGGVTTQVTDNGNTNQKIQYIPVPANSTSVAIYGTDDTTLKKTITIKNICEPKFTPYKVTFVNKYGAYEDFWFYKKTTETFDITDEFYKANIIENSSASYNTYTTQNQRFNVNAETSITMNTGFILENMTSSIEQMFLSENVWIRWSNKTLPIIPKTKSMQKKTVLNNKLIDFTIDFKFAFNKINDIR